MVCMSRYYQYINVHRPVSLFLTCGVILCYHQFIRVVTNTFIPIQLAMSKHCHIFTLPPNSTGILQCLDLGVFGPFKKYLGDMMLTGTINGVIINKVSVPIMICDAWAKAATPDNICAGWGACGMRVIDDSMGTRSIPSDPFNYKRMGTSDAPIVIDQDDVAPFETLPNGKHQLTLLIC
jgi:hypothetical protein